MLFSLDKFEVYTGDKILQRGIAYYHDGQVGTPERLNENTWLFNVTGSSIYQVQVQFNGADVEEVSCNCPHDSIICKHIVACLLELRDVMQEGHPLP